MNIGIYLGNFAPDLGGNFTFQDSILRALESLESEHSFFVFVRSGKKRIHKESGPVRYVYLKEQDDSIPGKLRRRLSLPSEAADLDPLQHEVERHRIDLMWYLTHSFEMVEIPYICTVLDLEHRVHPFFPEVSVTGSSWENREQLFSTMIPRAAYVISGTEAGRRQIIDFYRPDPERVRVVPFPVSRFAREEGGADAGAGDNGARPYLFYPAQFWPHKNHVVLLEALKLLRERHRLDLGLILCGSDKGNLSYVQETARSLGVEEYLQVLGFVPIEQLRALYRGALALTYPSLFGPDNLPPIEAFALGCPVIAARVAGAAEQMGDAALLVDPLSEEEIVQAVLTLWGDPALRQTLTQRGRLRVADLTPRAYVESVTRLCDEFARYRRCWSSKEKYIHL